MCFTLAAIMIFKPLLLLPLVATAASIEPAWLETASKIYETCIFKAIDGQYETGRFSEKNVLSNCAKVRRVQVRVAQLAAAKAADKNGEAMVDREFARLDQMIWTIVGHLRERRGNKRNVS